MHRCSFETPVTYNSVSLSWVGYSDASGGNVDFIGLMARAPFSVSSGPSLPFMPGGSTTAPVTSGGGGYSISSSSINEFVGPYGLGINASEWLRGGAAYAARHSGPGSALWSLPSVAVSSVSRSRQYELSDQITKIWVVIL